MGAKNLAQGREGAAPGGPRRGEVGLCEQGLGEVSSETGVEHFGAHQLHGRDAPRVSCIHREGGGLDRLHAPPLADRH